MEHIGLNICYHSIFKWEDKSSTPWYISSFNPFFYDPIVHILMVYFHFFGQGYLLSVVPSISFAISPIFTSLMRTLIPKLGPVDDKEDSHAVQVWLY